MLSTIKFAKSNCQLLPFDNSVCQINTPLDNSVCPIHLPTRSFWQFTLPNQIAKSVLSTIKFAKSNCQLLPLDITLCQINTPFDNSVCQIHLPNRSFWWFNCQIDFFLTIQFEESSLQINPLNNSFRQIHLFDNSVCPIHLPNRSFWQSNLPNPIAKSVLSTIKFAKSNCQLNPFDNSVCQINTPFDNSVCQIHLPNRCFWWFNCQIDFFLTIQFEESSLQINPLNNSFCQIHLFDNSVCPIQLPNRLFDNSVCPIQLPNQCFQQLSLPNLIVKWIDLAIRFFKSILLTIQFVKSNYQIDPLAN